MLFYRHCFWNLSKWVWLIRKIIPIACPQINIFDNNALLFKFLFSKYAYFVGELLHEAALSKKLMKNRKTVRKPYVYRKKRIRFFFLIFLKNPLQTITRIVEYI